MSNPTSTLLNFALVVIGIPAFCCGSGIFLVLTTPETFLERQGGPNDGGYGMALVFGVIPMIVLGSFFLGLILAVIFAIGAMYVHFRKPPPQGEPSNPKGSP